MHRHATALRRGRYTRDIDSSVAQDTMDTQLTAHSLWSIPLPASARRAGSRRIRVRLVSHTHEQSMPWFNCGGAFSRCCAFLGGLFAVYVVLILLGTEETGWAPTFRDSTLVFSREELQRIWRWEIDSGHHPSNAKSMMLSIIQRV